MRGCRACDSDPACEAALDVLPGLIVPEFHEFFTADDGRADHFNAGKYPSSAKAALLKCYQAQNYSEGGGDPCGDPRVLVRYTAYIMYIYTMYLRILQGSACGSWCGLRR